MQSSTTYMCTSLHPSSLALRSEHKAPPTPYTPADQPRMQLRPSTAINHAPSANASHDLEAHDLCSPHASSSRSATPSCTLSPAHACACAPCVALRQSAPVASRARGRHPTTAAATEISERWACVPCHASRPRVVPMAEPHAASSAQDSALGKAARRFPVSDTLCAPQTRATHPHTRRLCEDCPFFAPAALSPPEGNVTLEWTSRLRALTRLHPVARNSHPRRAVAPEGNRTATSPLFRITDFARFCVGTADRADLRLDATPSCAFWIVLGRYVLDYDGAVRWRGWADRRLLVRISLARLVRTMALSTSRKPPID
ncbi:hypothetical protein C8J57DRAFT_1730117 [Mycena rebaudengoi]|nr:hypothetical protein C8J57DRAFT_1730117 [Mycena rebaudengoi]